MNHAHNIELLAVEMLVPYAKNARTHSGEQIEAVARSIERFGFTNPVLIDADGGIVAGHGRVLAAKHLSLEKVPCLRVTWLSEAEKRAYVLADNQLAALSDWDETILKNEIVDLRRQGIDPSELAFGEDFLADLFDAGQMKKSFDRGVFDDTAGDDEPQYQNPGRYPVTMILDEGEYARWDALKARKGMSDKRLLIHLMEKNDA